MHPAVSLVRVYLAMNGFFTETEFSVIAHSSSTGVRSVTDIDILAVRFPRAHRYLPSDDEQGRQDDPKSHIQTVDARLQLSATDIEFIIAEVKEGRAELNRGAVSPEVMRTALTRFGAFDPDEMDRIIDGLVRKGESTASQGKRVRVFAFGSSVPTPPPVHCSIITHGEIVQHINTVRDTYQDYAKAMQFGDDLVTMFMLLFKSGVQLVVPDRTKSQ